MYRYTIWFGSDGDYVMHLCPQGVVIGKWLIPNTQIED